MVYIILDSIITFVWLMLIITIIIQSKKTKKKYEETIKEIMKSKEAMLRSKYCLNKCKTNDQCYIECFMKGIKND